MAIDKEKEMLAESEWEAAKRWAIEEGDKVTARLKAEGKYLIGLDTFSSEYAYIDEELKRRLRDIQERYGMVPDGQGGGDKQ